MSHLELTWERMVTGITKVKGKEKGTNNRNVTDSKNINRIMLHTRRPSGNPSPWCSID